MTEGVRARPQACRHRLIDVICGGVLALVAAGCDTGQIGREAGAPGSIAGPGTAFGDNGADSAAGRLGWLSEQGAGASGLGSGEGETCDAVASNDVGPSPLRRLTREEYARTLQMLFALAEPPDVGAIPVESERDGFAVHSELQTLSAQHMRGYLQVAGEQADALLSDAARRTRVIGCDEASPGCLPSFVARFGRMAFRRPLSMTEQDAFVEAAQSDATGDDRLRYVIEALLLSPQFLYRVELGREPAQSSELPQRLGDYELASRMSFAIVGRSPSAALLDRAAAGELATPQGRRQVLAELLAEEAFAEFYGGFFEQWLGFAKLAPPKEPPSDWDDALLLDMKAETHALVDRYAFGGEPFFDVLTENQTLVTPRLASFYGLPAVAAPSAVVEIPAGHPRFATGLLTHASLLAKKTDGDAVALRGNWLRRTFLCRGLQIPQAVAATFGERLVGLTHTQIVRERNADDACKGCHALIDPIGVGFDRFDATGRFDADYVLPDYGIEPALPDAPDPRFESLAELGQKLQALPEVAQCLAQRTFLYAHGREPERRDRCTVEAARDAFVASGYDYRVLVSELLDSSALTMRRAPVSVAGGEAP